MDQMANDYSVEMDDEARSQLALDYTYGFDTSSRYHEWYLGDIIVNGQASEDDIKHFTRHSLMRGYEEWYLMLSCANTLKELKEASSSNDPLEGRDLLTFLTEVLSPRSSPPDGVTSGQTSNIHLKREDVVQEPQSPQPSAKQGKRKRDVSREQIGPEQPTKKHGMNKISPFWFVNNPDSSFQQFHQAADDKKEPKNKKRKSGKSSKKRKRDRKARESLPESTTTPLAESLVLQEVPKVRHSQGNISASLEFCSAEQEINSASLLKDREADENKKPEINGAATHKRDSMSPQRVAKFLTPKHKTKSPYFDTLDTLSPLKTKHTRPPRGTIPCVPFPCLDAPNFGLIQEDLATDPFRLLIAVTFLIRVKGKHSIPVFHDLVEKYPTPRHLAEADKNDIIAMIRHLGLSAVRATIIQKYARIWIENPPRADIRYGVKNYPHLGDGVDVRTAEIPSPNDPRSSAWEIGHMTQGRYAIDSWRIFCRDVLLGRAEDWRGKGREGEFQPEWMRVLPEDKELRACLRWLWMQEGYAWDPKTGEKDILPEDLRRAVNEGRVAYDDAGRLKILHKRAPTESSTL
ncbi:DNA glycosylase [Daldinia grandis]|nr:DNA glycosylase [Daldinia grandis]